MHGEAGNLPGHAADHQGIGQRAAIDIGEAFGELVMHHDEARLRIGDHVFEDASAIGEVDRRIDRAEIVDREPDFQAVAARRQPAQDDIALPHAELLQAERRLPDMTKRLRIGPGLVVLEHDKDLVGRFARAAFEQCGQDAVFGRWNAPVPKLRHVAAPCAVTGWARPSS